MTFSLQKNNSIFLAQIQEKNGFSLRENNDPSAVKKKQIKEKSKGFSPT
jgi:hypothetical protein